MYHKAPLYTFIIDYDISLKELLNRLGTAPAAPKPRGSKPMSGPSVGADGEHAGAPRPRRSIISGTSEGLGLSNGGLSLSSPHQPGQQPGGGSITQQPRAADGECMVCHQQSEAPMMSCHGCSGGYHLACLQMSTMPSGNWFCGTCAEVSAAMPSGAY